MKTITKRIVSLLASVVTAASSMSLSFACAFAAEQNGTATSTATSDNEVKTSGFLSDLLPDEFDQISNDNAEAVKKDYVIYRIDYDYSKENLVVNYSAKEDCTIFVGFYNDEGTQLYTSVNENVTKASEGYVMIQLPEVLPDYYLIRAYMIGYLQNPLSKPFENDEYTKKIQDIIKKTPEQFESDKVIRFSDNDDYNFIVTKNEHTVIYSDESVDTLVSEDDESLTMTFDNIDKIKNIKEDQDVLVYLPEDMRYFRVDKIKINGSEAIITKQDLDYKALLDYIKFDISKCSGEKEETLTTYENEYIEDGYIVNNNYTVVNDDGVDRKPFPALLDGFEPEPFSVNLHFNIAHRDTEDDESKNKQLNLSGTGYIELGLQLEFKIFYENDICHCKGSFEKSYSLVFEGEASFSEELGLYRMRVYWLVFEIVPKAKFAAIGEIRYDVSKKVDFDIVPFGRSETIEHEPEKHFTGSVKLEVTLGVELAINVFDKHILKFSIEPEIGIRATIESSDVEENEYMRHDCENCIAVNCSLFFRITFHLHLFGYDFNKKKDTDDVISDLELEANVKTAEYHYKNGILYDGPCDNKSHKIRLNVYEEYENDGNSIKNGKPSADAKLYYKTENGGTYTLKDDFDEPVVTDSEGKAEVWVKDVLLDKESFAIVAQSESGNKGQVSVGRLFDPTLKGINKFDIILDNNTDGAVPASEGINCGLNKDDPKYKTVYTIDKRVGESFDTKTNTITKRIEPVDIVDVYEKIELPSWVLCEITNTATGEKNPPSDVKQITITVYKPTDDIVCNMDSLGNCHVSGEGKIYDSCLVAKLNEKANENGELFKSILFDTMIDCSNADFTNLPVMKATIFDSFGPQSELPSFSDNKYLTEVIIPMCDNIHGSPFSDCINLKKVTLCDGIESIGASAFSNTSIEEFICPPALKYIDGSAFKNCKNLSYVSLNYGLESIGDMVFENTSIRKIKFPSTLKSIGFYSFGDCINLNTVEMNEGLKEIPDKAFFNTMLDEIKIPGSVEKICDHAFDNSRAKKVILNEGLKTISRYAFNSNRISRIEIPASVEEIGVNAFGSCSFLDTVIINGNIKGTTDSIFGYQNGTRGIVNAIIRDGVTEIPDGIFYNCYSLVNVSLPNGLKKIGKQAFACCRALEEIHLPDSITEIGDYAFQSCESMPYVNIPKSLTEINNYTFSQIGIKSLTIPSNITKIGESAFCGNKLRTVDIPESVTYIGGEAFSSNKLSSIVVPKSVTYLGRNAFGEFVGPTDLTMKIYILNPECQFDDPNQSVYHSVSHCNTIIYGYDGSTAEKYVTDIKNGRSDAPYKDNFSFKVIDTDPLTTTVTTTNATTTVTTKTTTVVTTNISPDKECVMVAVNDSIYENASADDILNSDKLRFFDQSTADENGVVSFAYAPDENETWSFMFISETVDNVIQRTIGAIDDMKTILETTVSGDANGDGEVDMSDAVLIMQALANPNKYGLDGTAPVHLTLNNLKYSDVEGEGNGLTANDALQIQKYLLGQIKSLSN